MVKMINGLLWDTKKAELVFSYVAKGSFDSAENQMLYRTEKGRFFLVCNNVIVMIFSEPKAKDFVYSRTPNCYTKIFGTIEEA